MGRCAAAAIAAVAAADCIPNSMFTLARVTADRLPRELQYMSGGMPHGQCGDSTTGMCIMVKPAMLLLALLEASLHISCTGVSSGTLSS
jgi:hypothetical protein